MQPGVVEATRSDGSDLRMTTDSNRALSLTVGVSYACTLAEIVLILAPLQAVKTVVAKTGSLLEIEQAFPLLPPRLAFQSQVKALPQRYIV